MTNIYPMIFFSFSYLSVINMCLIFLCILEKYFPSIFFTFINDKYLTRIFFYVSMINIYLMFILFINENRLSRDFSTNDEFLCFVFFNIFQ